MKKFLFPASALAVLIGACVVLPGCSPLVLLNAAAPAEGFSRQTDIAYGPLPRQKLDVYVPDAAGWPAEHRVYPDVGHGRVVAGFSPLLARGVPVIDDVMRFIDSI